MEMKCRECNAEENSARKKLTARSASGDFVTHHECEQGHRWHILYNGRSSQIRPCDCRPAKMRNPLRSPHLFAS